MPGVRDRHAGCVGEYLVRHDLFDFLLLSLPDNDNHSHKLGPDSQVAAIAQADRQIVLGIQAVGEGVSELAAAFGLAIEMGATLHDIAGTIHAHPTLGEALQEASLKALGHAIHI